jgi:hypothetical protein
MSYCEADKLSLEAKNVLIGHRLRLNGANGINFTLNGMPGLWMSEIDITFQLPDEVEGEQSRRSYLANALMCINVVPYENQSPFEHGTDKIKKALVDIATTIRDDEEFRFTDNYCWTISGHFPLENEFAIQRAAPDFFGTVLLTPVFRSGDPVTHTISLDD